MNRLVELLPDGYNAEWRYKTSAWDVSSFEVWSNLHFCPGLVFPGNQI